jgi:hypothetical protein
MGSAASILPKKGKIIVNKLRVNIRGRRSNIKSGREYKMEKAAKSDIGCWRQ